MAIVVDGGVVHGIGRLEPLVMAVHPVWLTRHVGLIPRRGFSVGRLEHGMVPRGASATGLTREANARIARQLDRSPAVGVVRILVALCLVNTVVNRRKVDIELLLEAGRELTEVVSVCIRACENGLPLGVRRDAGHVQALCHEAIVGQRGRSGGRRQNWCELLHEGARSKSARAAYAPVTSRHCQFEEADWRVLDIAEGELFAVSVDVSVVHRVRDLSLPPIVPGVNHGLGAQVHVVAPTRGPGVASESDAGSAGEVNIRTADLIVGGSIARRVSCVRGLKINRERFSEPLRERCEGSGVRIRI